MSGASASVKRFNPRLPRGRRRCSAASWREPSQFQSAPPAREATRRPGGILLRMGGFNPRLPRGRRRRPDRLAFRGIRVSIRASRAGGDLDNAKPADFETLFQSAPPAREATASPCRARPDSEVSIRASRAGGDLPDDRGEAGACCFNPRLPRGRRRSASPVLGPMDGFNPRLPRGRRRRKEIIAALRESFNPRLPRGRRPHRRRRTGPPGNVSIRASRAGGDRRDFRARLGGSLFQSAPPAREATNLTPLDGGSCSCFNPREAT